MTKKIAIALIAFYQKWISPHKGYTCAHLVVHKNISCSAAVKNIVREKGLISGYPDIKERFKECRYAYISLTREKNKKKDKWWHNCDVSSCIPCPGKSKPDGGALDCELPCDFGGI